MKDILKAERPSRRVGPVEPGTQEIDATGTLTDAVKG